MRFKRVKLLIYHITWGPQALSVRPSEEFRQPKLLPFGDLQNCLDTFLQMKSRRPGLQGTSEKHCPGVCQSLGELYSFQEYWPCFSWRRLWGDAEGNRMSLCSFLEELRLSCKPEACAGLLPCGMLAWLTDTRPASSSMVRVSSVGHALWLAMLLFAISLPSWIRAATDCWGVARSSSLWWTSFVLLSPSSWQWAATGSQPWPSRPPQCPACMLSQCLHLFQQLALLFLHSWLLPPTVVIIIYYGYSVYIMCPESSTAWIATRVPLCGQKHAAIHSCSTSIFTRLSRGERLRGKEWRWLLAPISTIWCDTYSLSCVTWLQQQHSWVQNCFFSTLLSIACLPLFLLSSRKHLRCFPKVMVSAQSQFNSPLLWMQMLLGFQLLSRSNALRPQHGYVGHRFLSCFSPPPSSLGFSVHAGSFVHVSFSVHFTLPPHLASLKTPPSVQNRGALTPTTYCTAKSTWRKKQLLYIRKIQNPKYIS